MAESVSARTRAAALRALGLVFFFGGLASALAAAATALPLDFLLAPPGAIGFGAAFFAVITGSPVFADVETGSVAAIATSRQVRRVTSAARTHPGNSSALPSLSPIRVFRRLWMMLS